MKGEVGFKERMHHQKMKEISRNAKKRKLLESKRDYDSYPSRAYTEGANNEMS